jgi:hypothetical protein
LKRLVTVKNNVSGVTHYFEGDIEVTITEVRKDVTVTLSPKALREALS